MKLEYAHQRVVNVIIDSYCIFSVNNNGNPYFSFLIFDCLFQLCFKFALLGKQEGGY